MYKKLRETAIIKLDWQTMYNCFAKQIFFLQIRDYRLTFKYSAHNEIAYLQYN